MSNGNDMAFPVVLEATRTPNDSEQLGLTKREAFAMAALQGISANPNFFGPLFQQNPRAAADYAVDAADALLAELAK
jgi:hypothetical protein